MKAAIQLVVAGSPQIPKQFLYQKTWRRQINGYGYMNVEEWRHLATFPELRACRIPQQKQGAP